MPIVQLYYKDDKITGNNLVKFIKGLTDVVASQMTVETLGINIEQKNVRVLTSRVSKYDCNVDDLTIIIFVHDYPERLERSEEICKTVKSGIDYFLTTLDVQLSFLVHIVFAHIETA